MCRNSCRQVTSHVTELCHIYEWYVHHESVILCISHDIYITEYIYHIYFTTELCHTYERLVICTSWGCDYLYITWYVYHRVCIAYVFYHWGMSHIWMSPDMYLMSEWVCVYRMTCISHNMCIICIYEWVVIYTSPGVSMSIMYITYYIYHMYFTTESCHMYEWAIICTLLVSQYVFITWYVIARCVYHMYFTTES